MCSSSSISRLLQQIQPDDGAIFLQRPSLCMIYEVASFIKGTSNSHGVQWVNVLQGLRQKHNQAPFMSSGSDPFVGVMLGIPRLLNQGSASDELLQLHSIAYLAAAVTYCCQRTRQGAPGWCSNAAGKSEMRNEHDSKLVGKLIMSNVLPSRILQTPVLPFSRQNYSSRLHNRSTSDFRRAIDRLPEGPK